MVIIVLPEMHGLPVILLLPRAAVRSQAGPLRGAVRFAVFTQVLPRPRCADADVPGVPLGRAGSELLFPAPRSWTSHQLLTLGPGGRVGTTQTVGCTDPGAGAGRARGTEI